VDGSTTRRSARALLLTILGEFVLPDGAAAWTGTLVGALGACDVEEKAARQALARAGADGWLRSERHGRRAQWHLTDAAVRLLTEGTERIYSFGANRTDWDGRWLLVLASVPESRRDVRYRMRTRLAWAGFGALASGAWISPDTGREKEAADVLAELGVDDAVSFVGRAGEIGAVEEMVHEAWDLHAVATAYAGFLSGAAAARPRTPGTAFAALVRLVHEWRRFPFVDPALPPGLLPRAWPGAKAAAAFHDRHARWSPDAWTFYSCLTDYSASVE
jgi:phenylacetic acid degradation operon negative regulatory protein